MKIVVLVKQVLAAAGGLRMAPDLTVDRADGRTELNPADEYAIDQAKRIALCRRDVHITAVTMGPAGAVDALRRALVLGADDAVHVVDEALRGCDALATSRVLAAAIGRLGFDLVICGTASADSGMSAIPPMVAERLGVPVLCAADTLRVTDRRVHTRRDVGACQETYSTGLPAVVSVTGRCGEPGYPRLSSVIESRNKFILTWSLADLGIERSAVGLRTSATRVLAVTAQAARTRVLIDEGAPGVAARLADFLAQRQFL